MGIRCYGTAECARVDPAFTVLWSLVLNFKARRVDIFERQAEYQPVWNRKLLTYFVTIRCRQNTIIVILQTVGCCEKCFQFLYPCVYAVVWPINSCLIGLDVQLMVRHVLQFFVKINQCFFFCRKSVAVLSGYVRQFNACWRSFFLYFQEKVPVLCTTTKSSPLS
jgi:hypothetical protein